MLAWLIDMVNKTINFIKVERKDRIHTSDIRQHIYLLTSSIYTKMLNNICNIVEIRQLCTYDAIIYILHSICRTTNTNICSYMRTSGSILVNIYDEIFYDEIILKNPQKHISTATIQLI